MKRTAFSLVELSIVLVILGLLVGGILAGQSLIRASELRAVGAEYQRYTVAVHAFRDKYFALPGDLANATSFWGKDTAKCNSHTGTGATPGTCNGTGEGRLNNAGGADGWGEVYRFWQHLALAGLIEGTFTGNAGPINQWDMVIGTNIPTSKMSGAGWGMREYYDAPIGNNLFDVVPGNWLQFGADGSSDNAAPILRPAEAWNIDTKLDDGKPGTGKMIIRQWAGCTNAASASDFNTTYKLDVTTVQCVLVFPRFTG